MENYVKKIIGAVIVIALIGGYFVGCDLNDSDEIVENSKDVLESGKEFLENTVYDISGESVFDDRFEILSGDIEKRQITANNVSDIRVISGGCAFTIATSDDEYFYIEGESVEKLQAYEESGRLIVHAIKNSNLAYNMKVTLYIPGGKTFNKAEIDLGAGFVEINSLLSNDISLSAGAGSIDGSVLPNSSMSLNCDMGNISVTLGTNKEAYDYLVSVTAGIASIGDEDFTGVSRKLIDNGAGRRIEVDVAMGNITLDFTE